MVDNPKISTINVNDILETGENSRRAAALNKLGDLNTDFVSKDLSNAFDIKFNDVDIAKSV